MYREANGDEEKMGRLDKVLLGFSDDQTIRATGQTAEEAAQNAQELLDTVADWGRRRFFPF